MILAVALLLAQFEVASVKANHAGKDFPAMHSDPGRFTATNMTVKALLAVAYGIRQDQISGGPAWTDSEGYDIAAKAEHAVGREEQQRMLQALLTDRFKLKIRRDTKDVGAYELVVAKSGPKLHRAKEGEKSFRRFGLGKLGLQAGTMEQFARLLSGALGRTVVDRTGIVGEYDVNLEYTPEGYHPKPPEPISEKSSHEPPPPDPNGPTIFAALQEQLGLKLESRKAPGEVLIVEHAERPQQN